MMMMNPSDHVWSANIQCTFTSIVLQSWAERQAGIFEKAPSQEEAVATVTGLVINCLNSFLYMCNYNVVVPSIRRALHLICVTVFCLSAVHLQCVIPYKSTMYHKYSRNVSVLDDYRKQNIGLLDRPLCEHLGVSVSYAGMIVGMCDLASLPASLGERLGPHCLRCSSFHLISYQISHFLFTHFRFHCILQKLHGRCYARYT